MTEFKIGDEVYHKSNPSVKWIIERISSEYEIHCSTVIKETLEQKKEVFTSTSIKKCSDTSIYFAKRTRDKHY